MQGLAPSEIFVFEEFRLDRRGGLFRCNGAGKNEPVAIGSRALDILGVLVERAGEVVSKEEIVGAVWPATVVEDSNLTVQISALRRVLDRGQPNGSCIQTVPGRGYRFVASVSHPVANVRQGGLLTNSSAESTKDATPRFAAPLPHRALRPRHLIASAPPVGPLRPPSRRSPPSPRGGFGRRRNRLRHWQWRPQRRLRSPSSRRGCRSSCYPSPISVTTPSSNILPT